MSEPEKDELTMHDRLARLEAAAIDAEIETGRHEETADEAKRHILVRIGRVGLGVMVLIAGLIMLPFPGPGLLTIAAGLALLASDVPFARRLLVKVRERVPSDSDGNISRPILFGGLAVSVATISFSVWWTFLR